MENVNIFKPEFYNMIVNSEDYKAIIDKKKHYLK